MPKLVRAGVNVALLPFGLKVLFLLLGLDIVYSINKEQPKRIYIDSGIIHWLAEVGIYECMYRRIVCRWF